MESYIFSSKSRSYKNACIDVLDRGIKSDTTRFLRRQSIELDRSSVKFNEILLPKFRANGKKSSVKYALAETVWYFSRRRDTKLIEKFGPIWLSMQDDQGNVNSNYGYQIFNNQSIDDKLEELMETKSAVFFIADESNQNSRNDLVCNNAVKVTLSKDDTVFSVEVIARSIDLVYGYPYDVFAAQVFGSYLIRKILEIGYLDLEPIFDKVKFNIENMHIYDKDVEDDTRANLEMLDDQSFYIYDLSIDTIRELVSKKFGLKDVDEFRSDQMQNVKEIKIDHSKISSDSTFNVIRADMNTEIVSVLKKIYGIRSRQSLKRLEEIFEFLKDNKFDRKNLLKDKNRLFYLHRVWNGSKTVNEVTVYEL